jgi:putative ABC transport system permease protein
MWLIPLRDLEWRRRRFAIAVAATGVVFALALLLSGVSTSFDNEIQRTVRSFHSDVWLVSEGGFGPFTGPTPFPATLAAQVRRLEGVARAEPVAILSATTTTPSTRPVNVIGVAGEGLGAAGDTRLRRGQAVVDASLGLQAGDRLDLNGTDFRVASVTHGLSYFAGIPNVSVSLADAQRLGFGGRPLATAIIVQGRPAEVPEGLSLLTNRDVEIDLGRPVHQAKQTIGLIRALLWAVAAGIIGAMVYLSTLERVRDLAVLKAIGVSTRSLLVGLVFQAVVLALASAALAVVLETAMEPAAAMSVEVSALDFMLLPLVAVAVGTLASLVALRRAVTVDPALAFGG